jgi:hypothetical protein
LFNFFSALEQRSGAEPMRWSFPPALAGWRIEADVDGRGFLPLDGSARSLGLTEQVSLRFTSPAGERLGPYRYKTGVADQIVARAERQAPSFECKFFWGELKELCYVVHLGSLLNIKRIEYGTEPGRMAGSIRPAVTRARLIDPAWRLAVSRCYGPTYNASCLELWRNASAVFEIPKTATDLYIRMEGPRGWSDVVRIPHTLRR